MRVTTTGPMTGNDVRDPARAPFVVQSALLIYFESEQSRQEYLAILLRTPERL